MLTNKIFKITAFCSVFILSSVYAQCGYLLNPSTTYGYIAARGGLAWHQPIEFNEVGLGINRSNYKVGPTGGISMGIGINAFRIEAETFITYNSFENIDTTFIPPIPGFPPKTFTGTGFIRHIAFMFNTFYDFCLNRCTSLYLGVGCGVDFYRRENTIQGFFAKKDANLFAFQFMPGLAYHLTPRLDLTLGYRLYMTERQKSADSISKSQKIPILHTAELGLRYKL